MANKLMTVLAAIGIAGSAVAGGALAAPNHEGEARSFSDTNASEKAGNAANPSNLFRDDASETEYPEYHGGPKSPY